MWKWLKLLTWEWVKETPLFSEIMFSSENELQVCTFKSSCSPDKEEIISYDSQGNWTLKSLNKLSKVSQLAHYRTEIWMQVWVILKP